MNKKSIFKDGANKNLTHPKTQKGITLVALIITIIVLLILAVVAINAIQNDGIIDYAKNARNQYQAAQRNEQAILDSYLAKLQDEKTNPPSEENNNNDNNNSESTEELIPCTACNYGYLDEWETSNLDKCPTCGSPDGTGLNSISLYFCEQDGYYVCRSDQTMENCPKCSSENPKMRVIGSLRGGCPNGCPDWEVYRERCLFNCTYGVVKSSSVALIGEDSVTLRDRIELIVKKSDGTTMSAEDFVWDSSNKTVATVSNGVITGVKALEVANTSKTIITATSKIDSSVMATKEITVKPIDCTECTYGYTDEWEPENPEVCTICRSSDTARMESRYLRYCDYCGFTENDICECGFYNPNPLVDIKQSWVCGASNCDGFYYAYRKKCTNNCTYGSFYN